MNGLTDRLDAEITAHWKAWWTALDKGTLTSWYAELDRLMLLREEEEHEWHVRWNHAQARLYSQPLASLDVLAAHEHRQG